MDSSYQLVSVARQSAQLPAVPDQVNAAHNASMEAVATEPTNAMTESMRSAAAEVAATGSTGVPVADYLEEAFEQLGVSSDRLKIMQESEVKAFTHKVCEEKRLSAPVRRTVVCFAGALLEQLGAQLPKDWFKVVTLLDILAVRVPIAIEDLPVSCAALVSIVRKADASEFDSWLTRIASCASDLAQSPHISCAAIPYVISSMNLHMQEQHVISAIDWHIEPASCETWVSVFSARFDVALEGLLRPSIHWVRQNSLNYALNICTWQAASKILLPRRLAQGIFCLSAVLANLITYRSLCPDRVELENWQRMFAAVPWSPNTNMHVTDQLLGTLFIATGTHLEALQEDTLRVLTIIADINQAP